MSDRVAIIGGSAVGRDHFPWPVEAPSGSVGNKTSYPVVRGAAQTWSWISVKKWRFAMEFGYEVSRFNADDELWEVNEGSGAIQFDFVPHVEDSEGDPKAPTRESDLVMPRFSNRLIYELLFDGTLNIIPDVPDPFLITNTSGSASYNDGSGEFLMVAEFYFDLSSLKFSFPSVYPFIALRVDSINATAYHSTDETGGAGAGGMVTIGDADGFSIYGDAPPSGDFNWESFSFASDAVTITPIEYWPYATKAGLPVYNTSTGAQLRNPLS